MSNDGESQLRNVAHQRLRKGWVEMQSSRSPEGRMRARLERGESVIPLTRPSLGVA